MTRNIAQFLSVLFHPLVMVTYMLVLLLLINPYAFGVNQLGEQKSMVYLFGVFATTCLIPLFAIFMMRRLEMIGGNSENERMDRIGPFLIAGIFYIYQFYLFYQTSDVPLIFKSALFGATIALFVAFIINLFSKISLHTVGMGALVGLVLVSILLFNYSSIRIGNWLFSLYLLLFLVVLLAGIVGSARLILEDHLPNDLYGGYLVGFATQVIALQLLT